MSSLFHHDCRAGFTPSRSPPSQITFWCRRHNIAIHDILFVLAPPSSSRNLLSSHNSSFHRSTESRLTTMHSPPPHPPATATNASGKSKVPNRPKSPCGSNDSGGFGAGAAYNGRYFHKTLRIILFKMCTYENENVFTCVVLCCVLRCGAAK